MKRFILLIIYIVFITTLNCKDISAVWVLPWSFSTEEAIDKMLLSLSKHNYNTLMAEIRYRADAMYIPNRTDSTYTNLETRSHVLKGRDFDALEYLIQQATKYEIDVHAWMTMLVITPHNLDVLPKDHYYYGNADWITTDNTGKEMNRFNSEGYFLDAGIPEVKEHLLNIVSDVVVNYPQLKGIHLDYIRYPGQDSGHHPEAIEEFHKLGLTDNYANRMIWKEDNISDIVESLFIRIKDLNPNILLSAAVVSDRFKARTQYSQNWLEWLEKGYIDNIYLMSYTKNDDVLNEILKDKTIEPYKDKIVIGLRAWNESKKPYKAEKIYTKIKQVKKYGFAGTCLFNYSGLIRHKYLERLGFLLKKKERDA